MIVVLAGACRDRRRVRFDYSARDRTTSRREVEPYRLVQMGRRWYLLAFDPDRGGWRTFRLDRMEVRRPEGARFAAREAPDPSALLHSTDAYYRRHHATVLVEAPADVVAQRLPAQVPVERVDDERCRVHATAESPQALALNLLMIDQALVVEETTPDVDQALRAIGDRIAAATS